MILIITFASEQFVTNRVASFSCTSSCDPRTMRPDEQKSAWIATFHGQEGRDIAYMTEHPPKVCT